MEMVKENKFFVYENKILRAAQPHFNAAMRYFKKGRKMMYGTVRGKKTDITKIAIKITNWYNNQY